MSFTHSVFWVQVWSLPFELVSEQVGVDIGNDIRQFVLGDDHKGQQIRQGTCGLEWTFREGERVWINYRYKRLLAFCYRCGRLGNDERLV